MLYVYKINHIKRMWKWLEMIIIISLGSFIDGTSRCLNRPSWPGIFVLNPPTDSDKLQATARTLSGGSESHMCLLAMIRLTGQY